MSVSVERPPWASVPSLQHEALLLLFRNRSELAPERLRDPLHVPLPDYSAPRPTSSRPTSPISHPQSTGLSGAFRWRAS